MRYNDAAYKDVSETQCAEKCKNFLYYGRGIFNQDIFEKLLVATSKFLVRKPTLMMFCYLLVGGVTEKQNPLISAAGQGCLSFEYDWKHRICFLSTRTAQTVPRASHIHSEEFVYYQNTDAKDMCLASNVRSECNKGKKEGCKEKGCCMILDSCYHSTLDMDMHTPGKDLCKINIINRIIIINTLNSRHSASANNVFSQFNIFFGQEPWICFFYFIKFKNPDIKYF